MQTAVKIWIWIFGGSGTKDVCEIYARPAAILRSFGPLRVSHCHCRATALTAAPWKTPPPSSRLPKNQTEKPRALLMAAFCSLHRCDIFITRAHEFYSAREQLPPILWEFRPAASNFRFLTSAGRLSETIRPRRSKRNCVHNALPANNSN